MGSATGAPSSTFRRRNSIATSVIPTKLTLPTKTQSSSFPLPNHSIPTVDFGLVSLKSQQQSYYTSLKDLLPSSAAANSPTAASAGAGQGHQITIRNRLVKQAAWAYLQPMTSSPASSGRHFFRRLWGRLSGDYFRSPVSACIRFINCHVIPTFTRVFDRLLQAIRVCTHPAR